MKQFADLYRRIDSTTSINLKVAALTDYFGKASDNDKLWTIALFTHRRPRRTISTSLLRSWAAELAKLPTWLFEESYHVVGDLAETIALVLPSPSAENDRTLSDWIEAIIAQRGAEDDEKKEFILEAWACLNKDERFLFNKLITGGFRMGVSQKLVTRALAKYLGREESHIAHRLMGQWSPQDTDFNTLLIKEDWQDDLSKPYPFYLAYALDQDVNELGVPSDWSAEWKWDGIRAQLIKRKGVIFLWSRGEELVTNVFPEFENTPLLDHDNFVMDGELVVYDSNGIRPFNDLQKRLGRKKVSKKIMAEYPVGLIAYDLLEYEGKDIRKKSFQERRDLLSEMIAQVPTGDSQPLMMSDAIPFESWDQLVEIRSRSRSVKAEGLMLKSVDGIYQDGRRRGGWWKWKVDPLTIDAVMLYAQRGHGRRSNLFTDFTFAVWDDKDNLVPFAKAYSGLTDKEFGQVTRFVNTNTIERFGPVRSVRPELVFEIAFEGINKSSRHKSGVALRFPRIKRWRKDKKPADANTLTDLKEFLKIYD